MTRPPCVRLCPAYPGNPRTRIEGESPPQEKGHTVFVASLLAMTAAAVLALLALVAAPTCSQAQALTKVSIALPVANAALLSGDVHFLVADPYEFLKVAD